MPISPENLMTSYLEALKGELIQVAAVAVVAIQDIDARLDPRPFTPDDRLHSALKEITRERAAQDRKWGIQRHSAFYWLSILGEEFGEACKVANEATDELGPNWDERGTG